MKSPLRICYVCDCAIPAPERFAVPGHNPSIYVHQACKIRLAIDVLRRPGGEATDEVDREDRVSAAQHVGLTEKELQVLHLLSIGYTNKKIAQELGVSDKRARNLVSNVISKLDAENRTQAVTIAWRRGLLKREE